MAPMLNSLDKNRKIVMAAAAKLEAMATPKTHRRHGPRPFPIQVMGALSMWMSLAAAWPSLKKNWPHLKTEQKSQFDALRNKLRDVSEPEFDRALANELIERARLFVSGVRSYLHHPVSKPLKEAPILWQRGTTRLRDFSLPNASKTSPPILVIPSLINRLDILDLDEGHSFLRALAANGSRVYAVDWGAPGPLEMNFSLSDYVKERLDPLLGELNASRQPLHLIGYCMGGLLALALASRNEKALASLSLLATPWDFHQPDPLIGERFLTLAAQFESLLQKRAYLPVDAIESLFALLQPMQSFNKFVEFSELPPKSLEARHFVLCEDWLNDGVPLTASVARECLKDWYGRNLPGRFLWRCGDQSIDPRRLQCPTLIVAPSKDRIVPKESALPLAKLIPHATLLEPPTGHIGMIASAKASHHMWTSLISWLEKQK